MKLIRLYIEWSLDIAEEFADRGGPFLWIMLIVVWLWTLLCAALFALGVAGVVATLWWLSTLAFWVLPLIIVAVTAFGWSARSLIAERTS